MRIESKIVALARERGSTANTRNGAMRWLLAHLGHPLPGIVATTEDGPLTVRCVACRAEPWQPCGTNAWIPMETGARFHRRRNAVHAKHSLTEVREYVFTRRGERAMRRFGQMAKNDAEALADELTRKCIGEVVYPYRKSDSPGDFSLVVSLGENAKITVRTSAEWGRYGRSCRYAATTQTVSIVTNARTAQLIPGLRVEAANVEGVRLVCDAEHIEAPERTLRVTWAEQSRGLSIREAKGYLIGDQLIEAASLQAAHAVWTRRIVKRINERLGVVRQTA